MHSLGVLHGDIAVRNMVYHDRDGQVLFIDFEFSELITEENASQKTQELRTLEGVLASVPTISLIRELGA